MKQNFNDCLNRLLKDEGGYTNDPRDPGGPTNFGITLKDYQLYINKRGTATDVKNMSVDQAKTIYKSKYWDALDCDNLSSGVDYSVFDYGVNSGIGRSKKVLTKFKTLSGTQLINAINDERMAFLRSLSTFPTFGKGWTRRVAGVRAHSLELAVKPSSGTSTGAAGAVVLAGGAAVATTPQHMWPWIIGGTIAAAIVAFFAFEWYKYNKKETV